MPLRLERKKQEKKMVRKHMWITGSQSVALRAVAEKRHVPQSAIVREALQQFFYSLLKGGKPLPVWSGDIAEKLLVKMDTVP